MELFTFGDVLRYRNDEFVFLAATDEIIYLARILNSSDTHRIFQQYRRIQGNPNEQRRLHLPVYCFVMLTTDRLKDRMAHLLRPDHDATQIERLEKIGTLNTDDLREMKETILQKAAVLPKELKHLVQDIPV